MCLTNVHTDTAGFHHSSPHSLRLNGPESSDLIFGGPGNASTLPVFVTHFFDISAARRAHRSPH
ncbi:hypothetical protein B0H34DRAFT_727706 [Crassisporium funariophilum]|nr:hypothetical protein B0H34DRAFT_727706 [Crassisporium funariophilum]